MKFQISLNIYPLKFRVSEMSLILHLFPFFFHQSMTTDHFLVKFWKDKNEKKWRKDWFCFSFLLKVIITQKNNGCEKSNLIQFCFKLVIQELLGKKKFVWTERLTYKKQLQQAWLLTSKKESKPSFKKVGIWLWDNKQWTKVKFPKEKQSIITPNTLSYSEINIPYGNIPTFLPFLPV